MSWLSKFVAKKSDAPDSKAPAEAVGKSPLTADAAMPSHSKRKLTIADFKKFIPLRDLDDGALANIPYTVLKYKKGGVLFQLGQPSKGVFYLAEGEVSMQPDADQAYQVAANTTRARLPLNSGSHCGATATAATDVELLVILVELNQVWRGKSGDETSCIELSDIALPDELKGQPFFDACVQAYRDNKLRLPSLPDVAIKLREAMKADIGTKEAVDIIQIDPRIVTKMIQVANSALYATTYPVTNCHDAVTRIGLNATRNLVTGISMKHLFQSKDPALMKGMRVLWKNSVYLSCLCYVLAQDCSDLNPDDALLAGLVADIGNIPVLQFAEQFPGERPPFEEIQAALRYFREPVGRLVLHTLGFPEQLGNIPHNSENWLYDSGDKLTLDDIVILAKLHSYFGTGKAKGLPYINSIPAYSKLDDRKLNPDFSLTVLHKAQNRINEAMHLLD